MQLKTIFLQRDAEKAKLVACDYSDNFGLVTVEAGLDEYIISANEKPVYVKKFSAPPAEHCHIRWLKKDTFNGMRFGVSVKIALPRF